MFIKLPNGEFVDCRTITKVSYDKVLPHITNNAFYSDLDVQEFVEMLNKALLHSINYNPQKIESIGIPMTAVTFDGLVIAVFPDEQDAIIYQSKVKGSTERKPVTVMW